MKRHNWVIASILSTTLLTACDDNDNKKNASAVTPTTYSFPSQFVEGADSVSYTGQTLRHLLISDIKDAIGGLERSGEAVSSLDTLNGLVDNKYTFNAATNAVTLDEEGKNLLGKIAGGYLPDGSSDRKGEISRLLNNTFYGWADMAYPIDLVRYFFEQADALSLETENLTTIMTEEGNSNIVEGYIDDQGRDFKQLVQKFLLGSITFSQATADYLQSNFTVENTEVAGKPYTVAEHHWDEAFGYFGAARDYNAYTDDEIAGKGGRDAYKTGSFDSNGNGTIEKTSEMNLGNSTNCAKRDRGTKDSANPTDYTKTTFDAFLAGREILSKAAMQAPRNLTNEELEALNKQAKNAANTWEKCIAATVVHYINDSINDLTDDEGNAIALFANDAAYKNLAKHWSEMKGFALGLQFNPQSPFQTGAIDEFETLHNLMGTAPVLPSAGAEAVTAYVQDLQAAKAILKTQYDFDQEHVDNW